MSAENPIAIAASNSFPDDMNDFKMVGRNSSGTVAVFRRKSARKLSRPSTWLKGSSSGNVRFVHVEALKENDMQGDKPKRDTKRVGNSGTNIRNGRTWREDPNPDVENKKGVEKWHEMRHFDPMVYATWLAVALPVVAADWRFVQDEKGEIPQDEIDWMNRCFGFGGEPGKMAGGGQQFLWDATKSLLYGNSPFEAVYWLLDGLVAVDMEWRHPRTIDRFHIRDSRLHQVVQISQETDSRKVFTRRERKIEGDRLCVFVNDQEGDNWWGKSLFRPALRAYSMKRDFWLDFAVLVERYGSGIPFVEIDGAVWEGLTADEKDEILDSVDDVLMDLRHGEKAFLNPGGPGVKFGMLGGQQTQGPDIMKGVDRCDLEIQVAALAQDLGLGRTDRGIRAIGEHFGDIRGNFILSVADSLSNRFAGPVMPGWGTATRVFRWNFPGHKTDPRFIAEGIKDKQFRKIIKDIPNLIISGALTPDDSIEDALRAAYDFGALGKTARGADRDRRIRAMGRGGRAPALQAPGGEQTQPNQKPGDNR